MCFFLQRNSISPSEREKYRPRSPSEQHDLKKVKKEEIDKGHVSISKVGLANPYEINFWFFLAV